jgi:hypothetical protein
MEEVIGEREGPRGREGVVVGEGLCMWGQPERPVEGGCLGRVEVPNLMPFPHPGNGTCRVATTNGPHAGQCPMLNLTLTHTPGTYQVCISQPAGLLPWHISTSRAGVRGSTCPCRPRKAADFPLARVPLGRGSSHKFHKALGYRRPPSSRGQPVPNPFCNMVAEVTWVVDRWGSPALMLSMCRTMVGTVLSTEHPKIQSSYQTRWRPPRRSG